MNRKLTATIVIGGAALASAVASAVALKGWERRAAEYHRALNVALHEAIGHYKGTLEAISSGGISSDVALDLLKQRPKLEVPNVGEAYADINLSFNLLKLEELTLVLTGPTKLLRFIAVECLRRDDSTALEVCSLEEENGLGTLHIQLVPFSYDDEMLDQVRDILGF